MSLNQALRYPDVRSFRSDWDHVARGWSEPNIRALSGAGTGDPKKAAAGQIDRHPSTANSEGKAEASALLSVVRPDPERHRLIPQFRTGDRKFEAGRDLFEIGFDGHTIYNLLDGWVALYTLLEDGRRQIVQFGLPGAVLGILPCEGEQSTFGVQALTDVVVSVIPYSSLVSYSRDDPAMGLRLARLFARDCSLAFSHLTSIGRRSARERVAHLLLELFIRFRAQWPGNRIEEMCLPLTQEQIGDATGLTFVHVNRVLSALRKERIAEFHYRRLRILNPDKLMDVAGVDPQMAAAWMARSWPKREQA